MLATGLCSQPAAWHKWVRALRLTTDNVMATATDGGGPRRWRWSLRQWAALLAMEPQVGILTLPITDYRSLPLHCGCVSEVSYLTL